MPLGDIVLTFTDVDGDGPAAASLSHRILHGPEFDQPLAVETVSGAVQWLLADNLGTIRDVAEYNVGTNTTSVVNHMTYNAFGVLTGETSPAAGSAGGFAYGFTGREHDAATGLVHYRARWYDPQVGRFISEDPLGFAAQDVNLSRYVENGPTNAIDPSGLQPKVAPTIQTIGGVPHLLDDASGRFRYAPLGSYGFPNAAIKDLTAGAGEYDITRGPNGSQHPDLDSNGLPKNGQLTSGSGGTYWGNTYDAAGQEASQRTVALGANVAGSVILSLLGGLASLRNLRFVRPNTVPVRAGYTRVYRVVSKAELKHIAKTRSFKQGPNSAEGKWFADTLEGARQHASNLYKDGQYALVEADVPQGVFTEAWLNLDGFGPARFLDLDQLKGVTPRVLLE